MPDIMAEVDVVGTRGTPPLCVQSINQTLTTPHFHLDFPDNNFQPGDILVGAAYQLGSSPRLMDVQGQWHISQAADSMVVHMETIVTAGGDVCLDFVRDSDFSSTMPELRLSVLHLRHARGVWFVDRGVRQQQIDNQRTVQLDDDPIDMYLA